MPRQHSIQAWKFSLIAQSSSAVRSSAETEKSYQFSSHRRRLLLREEVAAEGDRATLDILCNGPERSSHVGDGTLITAKRENEQPQLSRSAKFAVLLGG